MSDYTDMEFSGGRLDNGETFTEPTLGQRVIYVIMNASVIKRTINTNTYYETHDIHFPTVRTSDNTPEQVSLNMSANNYYVSGEDEDCGTLTAEIDYNGWTNGDDHVYLVRTIPNTEEGHDGEWEWKDNWNPSGCPTTTNMVTRWIMAVHTRHLTSAASTARSRS